MVADRLLKRSNIRRLTAASVALVFAVGACSDGGEDSATPATTSSTTRTTAATVASTSTSTSVASEDTAARAGYEAASRAFIDAAAIPDPDAPAVAGTHVGPMLDQRRATLLGLRAEGKAIRYPTASRYRIEIESATVEGDVARLTVCVVDDGQRVAREVANVEAGAVTTVQGRVAMRRVDGVWKLAERTEENRWDGVAGCAGE